MTETTAARGIHDHPTRKLGKRHHDPDRPHVAFADFLATNVPVHPLADTQPGLVFPMDHNDSVGDCVVAGLDHALQLIYTQLDGSYTNWTDAFMLEAYQSQNPGFIGWGEPAGSEGGPEGPNDGGMDISTFLSWLVKKGVILGFAKVNPHDAGEVQAAIWLGLGVPTGEDLTVAQQSGVVWEYVAGSADWGGHCTCWGGYDPTRDQTVSWGSGEYTMTEEFIAHQVTEAYFVLTQAHVDHPGFRDAFDLAGFAAAVSQITSGKVVVPVPEPTPVPPSPSDDGDDQALWADIEPWVNHHRHVASEAAGQAAARLHKWAQAKGYAG